MSKVVVVGDLNVGKTCLINRYLIKKVQGDVLFYNTGLHNKMNIWKLLHATQT